MLPTKIAQYAKSLEPKSITDELSSKAIAYYGLQTKLRRWQAPTEALRQLRVLTRERDQIVNEPTVALNQLHAYSYHGLPSKATVARLKKRITLTNTQEKAVMAEIKELCSQHAELVEPLAHICSIPGIGLLTGAIILAETDGFSLIASRRQLSSYAGLDVQQKVSGSSVRTKPRISKQGNKYLRKALYLPAMSSAKYAPEQANLYNRLIGRHGLAKKAGVAVQRKILELAYTLVKNETYYDPHYQQKKEVEKAAMASST